MSCAAPRLYTVLRQAWRNNGTDEPAAFLVASVERLGAVRNGYGIAFAEEVLREAAARLTRESGECRVGYLGGDEFGVMLRGYRSASEAASLARRLLVALQAPYTVQGRGVYCGASVGIARRPWDGDDAATLMRNAAVALSHAKAARGERLVFFDSQMRALAAGRLQLESELREALERGQFLLHYQPRFRSGSAEPVGLEALLRWRHPERGIVPPAEFLGLLEETGALSAVGEWVLRRACRQLVEWHGAGLEPIPVAVNLSASQFRDRGLGRTIARIIDETGVDATLLEIEITESTLMSDPDEAVRILRQLERYGIRLSVDDFGTGYSSLAYLSRLPLHALKIDRAFVHDATTSRDGAAIAKAIVELAHALDLRVTAEGVETPEQRNFMEALGCDEMQGFLFAKPMPPEEAATLLSRAR